MNIFQKITFPTQSCQVLYLYVSLRHILICASTIYEHDQIFFSCTISRRSPFSPRHTYSSIYMFLYDVFLIVQLPFMSLIKFLSLAQFPEDHLSHPVMPTLVFLLCQFAAFVYYGISRFISFMGPVGWGCRTQ